MKKVYYCTSTQNLNRLRRFRSLKATNIKRAAVYNESSLIVHDPLWLLNKLLRRFSWPISGSLSSNDDDRHKNGTEKVKSPCFKPYRAYSISFNSSNVGIFLELNSKILYQSSGKEKESRCLVFTSSTKREIKAFSHRSRAVTAKKCTKKRDARAKLLFC